MDYTLGSGAHDELLLVSKVSSDVDLVLYSCPAIEFSFEDSSTGAAIDAAVFTYDSATLQFSIESSDLSKGNNIYSIRLKANLQGYSSTGYLDFSVTLIDPCETDPLDMSLITTFDGTITYSIYKA